MEGNGNAAQYWLNLSANAYAGMLQLIPLTIVTIISVYNHWKREGYK